MRPFQPPRLTPRGSPGEPSGDPYGETPGDTPADTLGRGMGACLRPWVEAVHAQPPPEISTFGGENKAQGGCRHPVVESGLENGL